MQQEQKIKLSSGIRSEEGWACLMRHGQEGLWEKVMCKLRPEQCAEGRRGTSGGLETIKAPSGDSDRRLLEVKYWKTKFNGVDFEDLIGFIKPFRNQADRYSKELYKTGDFCRRSGSEASLAKDKRSSRGREGRGDPPPGLAAGQEEDLSLPSSCNTG